MGVRFAALHLVLVGSDAQHVHFKFRLDTILDYESHIPFEYLIVYDLDEWRMSFENFLEIFHPLSGWVICGWGSLAKHR